MKFLTVVLAAGALLVPDLAGATTIYDSINVGSAFNGGLETANPNWDWIDPTGNGPSAVKFSLGSTQTLSSISLVLSADTPNDGGSLQILLVANVNGAPSHQTNAYPLSGSGTQQVTTFTNATLLGTIADSALSQTSQLVTIKTNNVLTAGSYWIGLAAGLLPNATDAGDGPYGSAQWWQTNPSSAVPTTTDFNNTGTFAVGGASTSQAYELIINTPEPGALAVLGAGLAGLGCMRRRRAQKT